MAVLAALEAAPPEIRWSHPDFLIEKWTATFGADGMRALAEWNNSPAPVVVRANKLKTTVEELRAQLPEATPHPFHPLALVVPRLLPEVDRTGLCYAQDPSTLAACDLLAPQPGETVLDACAAPGGKTTYLSALMRNEGRIVACDLWDSRTARLRENCERLGGTNAEALVLDTMKESPVLAPQSFDRILIDAPCSNTGVIRRRVDVRWRLTERRLHPHARATARPAPPLRRTAQTRWDAGLFHLLARAGGNEQVVEEALRRIPGLRLEAQRRLQPWVDGVDGAFCAKVIREA